jgi:hypothetical protein
LPALQAVGGADGDTLDVPAAERRVHEGCLRVMRDDDRDVAGSRARAASGATSVLPIRMWARSSTASMPGSFGPPFRRPAPAQVTHQRDGGRTGSRSAGMGRGHE